MNYDQIIALLIGLAGGQADVSAFETLAKGGYDPAYPVAIRSCPRPLAPMDIEGKTIICGTVSVPEDHDAPEGPRTDIVFSVLKSHSTYPEPDPLVHLHGGPGGFLLDGLRGYSNIFDPWRANRDIVLFDQRAAGLSGRSTVCFDVMTSDILELAGTASSKDESPDVFERCVDELRSSGVQLQYYNTYQNALDVRAITTTLGYETYNLYGISYGTKLSLEVMRSAPQGLRAVIIDGVASPAIRLYDTLAVPANEAIGILLDECAADAACNEAYPELRQKLHEAFDLVAAGKVVFRGEPLPPVMLGILFKKRNGQYRNGSYTRYLPAVIYEMAAGGKMPTLERLVDQSLTFPRPGAKEVRAAASRVTDDEERMIDTVIAEAEALRSTEHAAELTLAELKESLLRHRTLGPIPSLLDAELVRASDALLANPEKAKVAVLAYAALQGQAPSKEALRAFITAHFPPEVHPRLLALVDAMSDIEVGQAFEMVHGSLSSIERDFVSNGHLAVYACQEDVPYNSIEGYRKVTASLEFGKMLAPLYDRAAKGFFELCSKFEKHERPGFHDRVVSDIPTLAIGSSWDVQTAPSWPFFAAETLSNSQAYLIHEAGHGAALYQPCVVDMGVAFINDPARKLDNRCAESTRPDFYIAPEGKKTE